jgi:hypothetical protein
MRFSQFYVYSVEYLEDPWAWRRTVVPFEVGIELALLGERLDAPFRKLSLSIDPWIEPFARKIDSVVDVRLTGDVADVAALPVPEARSRWGTMTLEAIDLIASVFPWPERDRAADIVRRVASHAGPYKLAPLRVKDRVRGATHTTRMEIDEAGIRILLDSETSSTGAHRIREVATFDMPDRPYLRFPAIKTVLVDDRVEYRDGEGKVIATVAV